MTQPYGRSASGTNGDGEGGIAPGTQAIDRALRVLLHIARTRRHLGISELADALDLRPSTVHRIVQALVHRGFLEQDARTERYALGPMTVVTGQVAERQYGFDRAQPVLGRLAADTGESVNLGLRAADHVLIVLRQESQHPLRFEQTVGTRVALHASATGKALLAFSEDPGLEVKSLGRLPRLSEHTITSAQDLLAELERTRERGYSFDDEEGLAGVQCVGAPVLGPDGSARAAIAVQVPSVRLPAERVPKLARLVRQAAGEIAAIMYPGAEV